LKTLKRVIRDWNKGCFDNLEERTRDIENGIASLDVKDEIGGLSSKELTQRELLWEDH